MRKLLLLLFALAPILTSAQGVATFESLPLPTADTYYVNFTAPGTDVGFSNGNAWFPCVYDTGFGASFLSKGFVYSNMRDSVTASYANQFSARPGRGASNSSKYAVAYGTENIIRRTNAAYWTTMMVTNTTLAYFSMMNGDGFAKKFGGPSGNDSDWYKMVIHGFSRGVQLPDSIEHFLADYRFGNNSLDFIQKDWRQIDLRKFYNADSIRITLKSSDNSSFGMNTPAYFCIDNLSIAPESVDGLTFSEFAEIAPNPARASLSVSIKKPGLSRVSILDATGRVISTEQRLSGITVLNISSLAPGAYFIRLDGKDGAAVEKFIKQ